MIPGEGKILEFGKCPEVFWFHSIRLLEVVGKHKEFDVNRVIKIPFVRNKVFFTLSLS